MIPFLFPFSRGLLFPLVALDKILCVIFIYLFIFFFFCDISRVSDTSCVLKCVWKVLLETESECE